MADSTAIVDWLCSARHCVALTGAGISTDSGIPDFRGPRGVWTRDPAAAQLVDYDAYVSDPRVRRRSWLVRRDHEAWQAQPTAGHLALARLVRAGRIAEIVTQNIDRLHQRSGVDQDLVIEVHGNMFEVVCLTCQDRTTMVDALRRVAAGEPDPACLRCGGVLKSTTIFFGQQLDQDTLGRAIDAAEHCDLLLAIGSSLSVHPAAGLVDLAEQAGARVVVVNASPTPYDGIADAVIREPIGEVLPALADAVLGPTS